MFSCGQLTLNCLTPKVEKVCVCGRICYLKFDILSNILQKTLLISDFQTI